LTNASGTVTDTYEYDAFGNSFTVSGSTPNEFMYRGEQYDSDLGLYYLRARYYNLLTGRFMSRDPNDPKPFDSKYGPADPRALHKYLYVGGDPTNYWGPTGRDLEEDVTIKKYDLASMLPIEIAEKLAVQGTIEVEGSTATFWVQNITGVIGNPLGLNALFVRIAVELGASDMYIVATIANEQLENILINRYGWVTVGGQLVWYGKI
jgi:RHS repeat-associated protein